MMHTALLKAHRCSEGMILMACKRQVIGSAKSAKPTPKSQSSPHALDKKPAVLAHAWVHGPAVIRRACKRHTPATSPVIRTWLMYSRNASSLTSASVNRKQTGWPLKPGSCEASVGMDEVIQANHRPPCMPVGMGIDGFACGCGHCSVYECHGQKLRSQCMVHTIAVMGSASPSTCNLVQGLYVLEKVGHIVGLGHGDLRKTRATGMMPVLKCCEEERSAAIKLSLNQHQRAQPAAAQC